MDALGRFIACIIAVILLFLFPIQYIAQTQEETIDDTVIGSTKEFTDTARNQGHITCEMYDNWIEKLDHTGELYDISIEVSHPVSGKDMSDISAGEIVDMSAGEIMPDVKAENLLFQGKTNDIKLLSAHTHTTDCLAGNLHVCDGVSCQYAGSAMVVAAGLDGLFYSTDGISWAAGNAANSYALVQDVTYGNGRFVAVGNSYTWYSADGVNWTRSDALPYYFRAVAYGNGIYAAVGSYTSSSGTYETICYSKDGINWSWNMLTQTYCYVDIAYTNGSFLVIDSSGALGEYTYNGSVFDGYNFTYLNSRPQSVFSLNGRFAITAYDNNYGNRTGLSLSSYTPFSFLWTTDIQDGTVTYGNGIYLAASINGVYTSVPTEYSIGTWTKVGSLGNLYPKSTIYFRNKFITAGYIYDSQYNSSYIGTSVDGITWSQASFTHGIHSLACNVDGGSGFPDLGPCIKIGKYYDAYGNEVQPICNQVITGITATNPIQTVDKGGIISTTAIATYLDGHTGIVNCTSNYNPYAVGTQTVTLSYYGLVGNAKTTGFVTCTISVTVRETNIPSYLIVTTSANSVYNGTEPSYSVTVVYTSGAYRALSSWEYSKSGFTAGPGTKTVTFSYYENGYTVYGSTTITVYPNAAYLSVTPSTTTVYNGSEPTYEVILTYENGITVPLYFWHYTKSGFTAGPGIKTVTFSYTENNRTITASVNITVLPNLTNITVSPASQSIKRYSNPSFTVRAYYEDGSNKVISGGYTVSGLNINNLGTQTVTISYCENNIGKSASVTVTINKLTTTCPICGTTYELDAYDIDNGCPYCASKVISIQASPTYIEINRGDAIPITVSAVYQNGKAYVITGWTSNYNPNIIGVQEVKISYQSVSTSIYVETMPGLDICPICHNPYRLNDDGSDPGCQICSKEVVSIKVLEDNVTIQKHQPLPITVTAVFKDGHTAFTSDWSTNFIPDINGMFDVTIFYQSKTDHLTVKVIYENNTICPYCSIEYDISVNPFGCPVCSKTIVGIEAKLRNGGTQVIYKSQLNLQIILIYKDTHRMITYTGYTVTGYHPDQLGIQTVMVHYSSFSTMLTIEVISGPAKVVCPNGHEYYLNEDGSDPGCPYCSAAAYKDKAIFYFETTYSSDIINAIYRDGIYHLNKGDYLTVTIIHRDVSLRNKLMKMFFGTNSGIIRKKQTFGGEVN